LSGEQLMGMRSMGRGTVAEVLALIEKLLSQQDAAPQENSGQSSPEEALLSGLADEISAGLGGSRKEYLRALYEVRTRYPDVQGETLLLRLYEQPMLQGRLKGKILLLVEEAADGLEKSALYEKLPEHLLNTMLIEEVLIALEQEGAVRYSAERIVRCFPRFREYVEGLADEKIKGMLRARLSGVTMEEIGAAYGNITRERVRQLLERQAKRIREAGLRFAEDRYAAAFGGYAFSLEDFMMAFGEEAEVYYYLEMMAPSARIHRKPLEALLEDESLSPALRRQVERVVYKDYAAVDGVRVRRERMAMIYHFVRRHCRETTGMDEFCRAYHGWLEEKGLMSEELMIAEPRTYENRFGAADYVLWMPGRQFRYYEMAGQDFGELLETLNIAQYENVELSALKLFRDHEELMAQYDIRDEYELHNLLKKIYLRMNDSSVDFARNPTMRIGEADRETQMLDFLLQYAPVTAEELGRRYEEEYGVKAATVLSIYIKNFSDFYFDGVFSVDADNLPQDQFDAMRRLLDRDFYMVSAVRALYKRTFPEADPSAINPYTLKTLGFRVYTGYVVRATWASAVDYFHHQLTDEDVVDGRSFECSVFSIQAYSGEMNRLRHIREIVEFAPRQYINMRRLNEMGITLRTLEGYCEAVEAFAGRNEFFSVKSLRADGFMHELDDLGFEEWFYGSVLLEDRERFSYQRIGGTRIFCRGQRDQLFINMLYDLVGRDGHMDIYQLRDLLSERYGIELHKDKLIEIIRSTDMYYDTIMQAAYIDYDTYFEEV